MVVNSGMFALFMPGEAHRPGCPDGNAGEQVFKLVFKIRI
jgi:beta-galactosidase beta subunit